MQSVGMVLQEALHNFGIAHGWSRSGQEYEVGDVRMRARMEGGRWLL